MAVSTVDWRPIISALQLPVARTSISSPLCSIRDTFGSCSPLSIHQFVVQHSGIQLLVNLLKQFPNDISVLRDLMAIFAFLSQYFSCQSGTMSNQDTAWLVARRTFCNELLAMETQKLIINVLSAKATLTDIALFPQVAVIVQWLLRHKTHATTLAAICRLNGTMRSLVDLLKACLVQGNSHQEEPLPPMLTDYLSTLLALCQGSERNLAMITRMSVTPNLKAHLHRLLQMPAEVSDSPTRQTLLLSTCLRFLRIMCDGRGDKPTVDALSDEDGVGILFQLLTGHYDASVKAEALDLFTILLQSSPHKVETHLDAFFLSRNTATCNEGRRILVEQVWGSCGGTVGMANVDALGTLFASLMRLLGVTELPGGPCVPPTFTYSAGDQVDTATAAYSPELHHINEPSHAMSLNDGLHQLHHIYGDAVRPACCLASSMLQWAPSCEPFIPMQLSTLHHVCSQVIQRTISAMPYQVVYDRTTKVMMPSDPPCAPWQSPALQFDSRFESGNLSRAVRTGEYTYDLMVDCDINSPGHVGQWFFFSVGILQPTTQYTFTIINMGKLGQLFIAGQQPVVYSLKAAELQQQGWHRSCVSEVCYYPNSYHRPIPNSKGGAKVKSYYSLHFTIQGTHADDTIYCAYSQPYTYSELLDFLGTIAGHPYCIVQQLGNTLAGHACPLVTITSPPTLPIGSNGLPLMERPVVAISARVHPAESCASWMAEGLLRRLTDPHDQVSIMLRERYVFKVVPMLNPDGVIHGNTRCSLAGHDLNRKWQHPDPQHHPTVYLLKTYLQYVQQVEHRPIFSYIDLHGHARQRNIFAYGCTGSSAVASGLGSPLALPLESIFPFLLSQRLPSFSFAQSVCRVQRARDTTARVVVWREVGVPLSYTVEASLSGGYLSAVGLQHSTPPTVESLHFNCEHYLEAGDAIVVTIADMEHVMTSHGSVGAVVREMAEQLSSSATLTGVDDVVEQDDSSDESDG